MPHWMLIIQEFLVYSSLNIAKQKTSLYARILELQILVNLKGIAKSQNHKHVEIIGIKISKGQGQSILDIN